MVSHRLARGITKTAVARWRAALAGGRLSPSSLEWFRANNLWGTPAASAKELMGLARGNQNLEAAHRISNISHGTPYFGVRNATLTPAEAAQALTPRESANLSRMAPQVLAGTPSNVLVSTRSNPISQLGAYWSGASGANWLPNTPKAADAWGLREVVRQHEINEIRNAGRAAKGGGWMGHNDPRVLMNEAQTVNRLGLPGLRDFMSLARTTSQEGREIFNNLGRPYLQAVEGGRAAVNKAADTLRKAWTGSVTPQQQAQFSQANQTLALSGQPISSPYTTGWIDQATGVAKYAPLSPPEQWNKAQRVNQIVQNVLNREKGLKLPATTKP